MKPFTKIFIGGALIVMGNVNVAWGIGAVRHIALYGPDTSGILHGNEDDDVDSFDEWVNDIDISDSSYDSVKD